MAKEDIQVNVRLPAELVERIKAAAEINGRSMGAEMTARLAGSFPPTLEEIQLDSLRKEAEQTAAHEFRLRFDKRATSTDARVREQYEEEVQLVGRRLRHLEIEISSRISRPLAF